MKSLLHNLSSEHVIPEPFPHLLVENVLNGDLCDQLISEYPPLEAFTPKKCYPENTKLHYPAARSLPESILTPRWRELVKAHVDPSVFAELVDIFKPHLLREYPDFEQRYGNLGQLTTGIRGNSKTSDVLLDAQAILHTAVISKPSVERRPHVKTCEKPFEAFFSLRSDEDNSVGTELEIYSVKPGFEPEFGPRQVVDYEYLRLVRTVAFRKNTLFVLLNTPRSIQAFGLRSPSGCPFTYFNFLAAMGKGDLFLLKQKTDLRPSSGWGKFGKLFQRAA